MSQRLSIQLTGAGADARQARELAEDIENVEGVESAGTLDTRSIDAASIGVWLQLAATALTTLVPAVEKVLELIRQKGISGVVTFPDGTSLKLDNISPADLKALLEAKGVKAKSE